MTQYDRYRVYAEKMKHAKKFCKEKWFDFYDSEYNYAISELTKLELAGMEAEMRA